MTIVGIIAIIAVVVLGVMVLRVKSDPTEKAAVRKILAEGKPAANSDIQSNSHSSQN